MLLFEAEGLLLVLFLLFWVYCIFDVISTEDFLCRSLPKTTWLILVLLLPDIGGLAWMLLGRPERASFRPGDKAPRRVAQGPDDDPRFGRSMFTPAVGAPATGSEEARRKALENAEVDRQLDEWEADLARREARRAELEQREAQLRQMPGDPEA